MEATFEKNDFSKRLKSMLKVDFTRMFTMPLVYVMAGICLAMPILILVMTTALPSASADPATGAEATAETFTNVWQAIGSASGESAAGMSLTAMCNVNLTYFLIAIFVCIFVADDFKSGYAKNLFTVRSKKTDYVISKCVAGFVGGTIMILSYLIGAMLGGAIAGLPFDPGEASAGGVVACIFSKIFLVAIFSSLALLFGVAGKQKLWISVLGSLAACALLFATLPMISPLDSTLLNVILCLAGGAAFGAVSGVVGNLILNKTNLV